MNIKNIHIGIIGMARSGIAAAEKALELGADVFLSESKKAEYIPDADKIKKKFETEFGGHSKKLLSSDLVIVSPGVPPDIPILNQTREKGIELISEIEFGFRIKHPSNEIIAITGSNGKSTTVSLIQHLLKANNVKSILAGNIGMAMTSFPIEKPGMNLIVLELSSYQLELIREFKAEIAAVLNITPDHLNRYEGFQDYARTKFRIFENQTEKDLAILNFDDDATMGMPVPRKSELRYFSLKHKTDIYLRDSILVCGEYKIHTHDLKLKGLHNYANVMAAILAVKRWLPNLSALIPALKSFAPLPHRMEFVRSIRGIDFYNDSKATNTESVKHALTSFDRPIRIIMGGEGKGEDYTVLNDLLKHKAKKVYLMGEERYEMYIIFRKVTDSMICKSFSDAIQTAYQEAQPGDCIILSPACTSFDMFNNFEERGDSFKKIVIGLTE